MLLKNAKKTQKRQHKIRKTRRDDWVIAYTFSSRKWFGYKLYSPQKTICFLTPPKSHLRWKRPPSIHSVKPIQNPILAEKSCFIKHDFYMAHMCGHVVPLMAHHRRTCGILLLSPQRGASFAEGKACPRGRPQDPYEPQIMGLPFFCSWNFERLPRESTKK